VAEADGQSDREIPASGRSSATATTTPRTPSSRSPEVIDNVQPLLSQHFNLTVELPLKAIVCGYSYAITPISWRNRTIDYLAQTG
jgi:hypothetical protein